MNENKQKENKSDNNSTSTIWMRNGLILIGIYAIVEAIIQLTPTMSILANMQPYGILHRETGWALLGYFGAPTVLVILGMFLIWNSHKITAYNFDDYETKTTWEPIVYKLTSTFCGILIFAFSLPQLGGFASSLAYWLYINKGVDGLTCLINAAWILIQIGFGFYLFYGAPHIVRWQIKRNPW